MSLHKGFQPSVDKLQILNDFILQGQQLIALRGLGVEVVPESIMQIVLGSLEGLCDTQRGFFAFRHRAVEQKIHHEVDELRLSVMLGLFTLTHFLQIVSGGG